MYEKLLENCGLTTNESLVYLALLKKGKSKSGEIIKEAKVSGGKIYETLYKLVEKGVVKYIEENGVKKFIANNPETLISYLQEKERILHKKEEELKKAVPFLNSLMNVKEKSEMVSLVIGLRGIEPIVYNSLEKGTDIRIMGVNSSKEEKFNNFWMHWHKHRVALKKKAKIIFSDKDTNYWKFFKKLRYTEVREILHFTPSAILIIDDEAFIFSYEDKLTCIHILTKNIASSFSQFFDDLWKITKN